jgi:hypothetical protein
MVPLLVCIPGEIEPIERGKRFEAPINRELRRGGRLGRVVGGGTTMCLGGPRFLTGCYLDVDVKDVKRALPAVREALQGADSPRGTRVLNVDTQEILLIAPAAGTLRPPRRRVRPPRYPWSEGEILGYRLSPEVLALLFVVQEGPYPVFRVLDWSGPAVPPPEVVRQLLRGRERRYALGERMYAVGWMPMGLRSAVLMPGRLDEGRIERSGLVVPVCQRHLGRRFCAFDSWTNFDLFLRKLFGLEPMTGTDRLMNEVGVGSLAHHLAVWSAPERVTAEQAFALFTAYVRKDRDKPTVPATAPLRQFVHELRSYYNRRCAAGEDQPWVGKFRVAEGFMIVPIKHIRADEVREVVRGLARRHGLTAYDPHREEVFVGTPRGERPNGKLLTIR